MSDFYDKHIGESHGRLTITGVTRNPRPKFNCSCECGGEKAIDVFSVLSGLSSSCGCLRKEIVSALGKSFLKDGSELLGKTFKNSIGLEYEPIKYENAGKVLVRFTESRYEVYAGAKEVKNGSIRDWIATPVKQKPSKQYKPRKTLTGQTVEMKSGHNIEVLEYGSEGKILIRNLSPVVYETWTTRQSIINGTVENLYLPTVSGYGYIGAGEYSASKDKLAREKFSNMVKRCYDECDLIKCPTYIGCVVTDEWFNFQNFCQWYYQQRGAGERGYQLDKDILQKGSKIYSPETCCLVPQEINKLLTKRNACRGDLPIGVSQFSEGVYRASCSDKIVGSGKWHGGLRNCPIAAFNDYKSHKEKRIKEVAEMFKDSIDVKVYDALMNYTVEITD